MSVLIGSVFLKAGALDLQNISNTVQTVCLKHHNWIFSSGLKLN